MHLRSYLLAGAVLPFALSYPALALDAAQRPPGTVILAQTDTACPEGSPDCVPPEGAQEQPQAEVPVEVQPEPLPVEEPPPVEPQSEPLPVEEPPPVEPQPEPLPVEEPPPVEPQPEPLPVEEPPPVEPEPEPLPVEEPPPVEPEPEPLPVEEPPAAEPPPAFNQPVEEQPVEEVPVEDVTPEQTEDPVVEEPPVLEEPPLEEDSPAEEPVTDGPPDEPQPPGEQPPDIVLPDMPVEEQPPVPGESIVEQQLEAEGDDNAAEQVLEMLQLLDQQQQEAETEAQATGVILPDQIDGSQPWWVREGGRIIERRGDRVVVEVRGQIFVEPLYPDRDPRLLYGAEDVEVQYLEGGYTRTIVYRDNGSQIVTIRDPYGDLVSRIRIRPDGSEVVLFDARYDAGGPPPVYFVPSDLPPLYVQIPQDQYIVDLGGASPQQIHDVLLAPPVEAVQRPYTVAEVTQNDRLRDIVPRIDLDTITFDFGSSTITSGQMDELLALGQALEQVIAENPNEVYLIEGHTDAVGSQSDNLILSDQRAEAVAVGLTYNFDIPPENLITEGYGEQYLKVATEEPERLNRRVAVRRITPLLQAQNQ